MSIFECRSGVWAFKRRVGGDGCLGVWHFVPLYIGLGTLVLWTSK